jgi:hypothetical protein
VTSQSLATSYLRKARSRLKTLDVLRADGAFSDVIREAQEIVELAMKGMLRHVGVEPPKWPDVGGLFRDHRGRFPELHDSDIERLVRASAWLRKEREFAFHGDIDFIPTEQYGRERRGAGDRRRRLRGRDRHSRHCRPVGGRGSFPREQLIDLID